MLYIAKWTARTTDRGPIPLMESTEWKIGDPVPTGELAAGSVIFQASDDELTLILRALRATSQYTVEESIALSRIRDGLKSAFPDPHRRGQAIAALVTEAA